jgi:hypothetical protein
MPTRLWCSRSLRSTQLPSERERSRRQGLARKAGRGDAESLDADEHARIISRASNASAICRLRITAYVRVVSRRWRRRRQEQASSGARRCRHRDKSGDLHGTRLEQVSPGQPSVALQHPAGGDVSYPTAAAKQRRSALAVLSEAGRRACENGRRTLTRRVDPSRFPEA